MFEINKIYHGDCLEVMKDIPDQSIDMILCDPPYGTTACQWDIIIPFESMWKQLKRVIKLDGAIVLFGSEPFSSALRMSNIKNYKYDWVWEKSQAVGHLNAYKMPMKNIENIVVFYGKQCTYNPILENKPAANIRPETKRRKTTQCYGNHSKESSRKIPLNKTLPKQTIRFNNCQDNLHPTQKPVPLMEYLIKTYTNKGELILDFAAGSCTTAVAAIQTGRRYICIEKEKKYCEIGGQKITQAQPQLF